MAALPQQKGTDKGASAEIAIVFCPECGKCGEEGRLCKMRKQELEKGFADPMLYVHGGDLLKGCEPSDSFQSSLSETLSRLLIKLPAKAQAGTYLVP